MLRTILGKYWGIMNNYYTPLSHDVFEEVKQASIKIWQSYDDTYGYATGKIDCIKDLHNIEDNGMYMVAMFDYNNHRKLADTLSDKAKAEINERYTAGGNKGLLL